jgi:hypothetical protein
MDQLRLSIITSNPYDIYDRLAEYSLSYKYRLTIHYFYYSLIKSIPGYQIYTQYTTKDPLYILV